jgi:uncharacterized phage infection (PIP) family protein YhgE
MTSALYFCLWLSFFFLLGWKLAGLTLIGGITLTWLIVFTPIFVIVGLWLLGVALAVTPAVAVSLAYNRK